MIEFKFSVKVRRGIDKTNQKKRANKILKSMVRKHSVF